MVRARCSLNTCEMKYDNDDDNDNDDDDESR